MDLNKRNIKLIIGLGNPDAEYTNTYHNVGHLFVDYFAKNRPISDFQFLISKSTEYMNNSGRFVAKAAKKSEAKPEEILIAHDDSDLELGKYKIDFARGAAGHHGVESVQAALKPLSASGGNDFWRLRIGIRPISPIGQIGLIQPKRQKAEEFVLKKISAADMATLKNVFEEITNKIC